MSTIKVDGIRSNGDTSGNDAITFANDGTCTAKVTNNLSNRNIMINGAMQVAQRSAGPIAVSDGSNEGYQTLDRFKLSFGNSAAGAANVSQSTDAPTGFTKSHKTDVTTVNTNSTGQQMVQVIYRIEGQDLRSSGWNHLSASSFLTFSFYFKTTKTGNSKLPVAFRTKHGTNYYYVEDVTVTDPTNWNRYTVRIPGNSNLQIDDAATVGMDIQFSYYTGPDKDTSSESTWSSTNAYSTSNSTNYFDSTSNDMFITGIQLEVDHTGSGKPTDFEHRTYAQELALCQRYYYIVADGREDSQMATGFAYHNNQPEITLHYPVMNHSPDLVHATGTNYYGVKNNNANVTFNSWLWYQATPRCGLLYQGSGMGSALTPGQAYRLYFNSDQAYIHLDAEL